MYVSIYHGLLIIVVVPQYNYILKEAAAELFNLVMST